MASDDQCSGLAHVRVRVSGIVSAPVVNVWAVVRAFSQISTWLNERDDGMTLETTLLPGAAECQIGARRLVKISGQRYVEELEGLDDHAMILKYAIINYPGSSNPFPHSLINFHGMMMCKSVTIGSQTYLDWSGTFETEPEGYSRMKREIEAWLTSGVGAMERFFNHKARYALPAASRGIIAPQPPPPISHQPMDSARRDFETPIVPQHLSGKRERRPSYHSGHRAASMRVSDSAMSQPEGPSDVVMEIDGSAAAAAHWRSRGQNPS